MSKEDDVLARVDDVVQRFVGDLAAGSARMAEDLNGKPEVRIYLDSVGVKSIRDLTPEQRREMTDIIFRAMNAVVHPGAN